MWLGTELDWIGFVCQVVWAVFFWVWGGVWNLMGVGR